MIGIFDSGLGGLTALEAFHSRIPTEDIIYFGDTGRVPYGTRSAETIIKYSIEDMNFLSSFGVDAILVACGTVSSTAISDLRARTDKKVYGVIDPAVDAAAKATKTGKIGVISTNATLKSGAFSRGLKAVDPDFDVTSVSCPLFVPLVENGFIEHGDTVTLEVAKRYLSPLREHGIDTLILGCTHYPIISWAISEALPGVTLINSGKAAADAVADDILSGKTPSRGGTGMIRCFCSDKPDGFEAAAEIFMGKTPIGRAEKIDIEGFRGVAPNPA